MRDESRAANKVSTKALTKSMSSQNSQLRISPPTFEICQTFDYHLPDSSLLSNNGKRDQNSPALEVKSANESSGSNEESSPNNSFLERSQSLRLSKKSLRSLSSKAGGSLRLSKKEALALKQVKEEACEEDQPPATAPNKQSFERKNSFLSKLFSSTNGSSPEKKKPKLATFSAQFPPPELVEQQQQIYQQLIPRARQFSNENSVGSSPLPPPKLYNEVNPQTYGYAMVSRRGCPPENGLYSAPPPPLPYRPPPPNPYLQTDADQYARILPKNQQQPQFTKSTTPPLPLIPAERECETYARVSNLKKVNNNANGSSPQRNVRFADEQSSSSGVTSTSSTSSRSVS